MDLPTTAAQVTIQSIPYMTRVQSYHCEELRELRELRELPSCRSEKNYENLWNDRIHYNGRTHRYEDYRAYFHDLRF